MELRAEPRFGTRSSAVVEAVRERIYTYDITITEVSGTGFRIEMTEELNVGENVRLLVNGYHLFAQVRRCVPSESGFIVGVERIDAWNTVPAATAPAKELGRTKLKNPLNTLHSASLQALFSDPRMRAKDFKYQPVLIAAGCIALAGWAGFGAGVSLYRKSRGPAPAGIAAIQHLPNPAASATVAAPPQASAASPVASASSSPAVVPPPLPKPQVSQPPVQKAVAASGTVAAPPKASTASPVASAPTSPAVVPPPLPKPQVSQPPVQRAAAATPPVHASSISIKASDASWLTACVDGAKVVDTLLIKGYAGQIPFSHQATLRFGNAGAIELAVGGQPARQLGQTGEVRTIKATPAGYELLTVPSALNCKLP